MASDRTIALAAFSGRKAQKAQFTFHSCVNSSSTEKLPSMFIEIPMKPRCFKKKTGEQLGLYYRHNKKAWMNGERFNKWLQNVDRIIGETPGCKILLLMDNCSAHGSHSTFPALANVKVKFLPPNTTSRLQPLDAGIIAALKMQYRKKQMEYAVDQLDQSSHEIYKIDILQAMMWLINAWEELSEDKIRNCWRTTGIVPAYDCDTFDENRAAEELDQFVQVAVSAAARLPVSNLLEWEQEIEVTQLFSDSDSISNILLAGEADAEEEGGADASSSEQSTMYIGTVASQLESLSHVMMILEAIGEDEDEVLNCLRRVQKALRVQQVESLQHTHIEQFFHDSGL